MASGSGEPAKGARRWRNLKSLLAEELTKTKTAAQSLLSLVRSSPHVAIIPLLVFAVLAAVGTWAVCYAAAQEAQDAKDQAQSIARKTAVQFAAQLLAVFSPVEVLSQVVTAEPEYGTVQGRYNALAPALLASAPALSTLVLAPTGFVELVMPEAAKFLQGMNGFDGRDPVAASEARKAVLEPGIAISGPVAPLPVGGRILVVRRAIFVPASEPNENFGRPDATNPLCGPGCDYNATTGMAFWGFAAGLVDIDAFLASKASSKELSNPLLTLDELGLSYTLVNADGVTVASSARAPRSAVQAEMLLPGTRWVLLVGRQGEWGPSWLPGVIVAVVACSALTAVLLFGLLASRRRNQVLLEALLPRDLITGLHQQHAAKQLGPRSQCMGSPSELLHELLEVLMSGEAPDLRDIVLLRTLLMKGAPWYTPINAGQQIRNANLDVEVERALMRQLGSATPEGTSLRGRMPGLVYQGTAVADTGVHGDGETPGLAALQPQPQQLTYPCDATEGDGLPPTRGPARLPHQEAQEEHHGQPTRGVLTEEERCATLRGALAMIVAPSVYTQPPGGAAPSPGGAAARPRGLSRLDSPLPLPAVPSGTGVGFHTPSTAMLGVEPQAQEQGEVGEQDGNEREGLPALRGPEDAIGVSTSIGVDDSPVAGPRTDIGPFSDRKLLPPCQSPLGSATASDVSHKQQRHQHQHGDQPRPGVLSRLVCSLRCATLVPSGVGTSAATDAAVAAGAASPAPSAEESTVSPTMSPHTSCPAASTSQQLWGTAIHGSPRSRLSSSAGRAALQGSHSTEGPLGAYPGSATSGQGRFQSRASGGKALRVAVVEAPAPTAPCSPRMLLASSEGSDQRRSRNTAVRLVLMPAGNAVRNGRAGSQGSPAAGSAIAPKRTASGSVDPGPDAMVEDYAGAGDNSAPAAGAGVRGSACVGGDSGSLPRRHVSQPITSVASYESLASMALGRVGSGVGACSVPGDGGRREGGGPELVGSLGVAPRAPDAPMLDEVERLLCHVDGTQYDTWALDAATGGHALSAMGFFLLQREGLVVQLALPPARLVRLLHALEAGYPANPYHNQVHAADVLRSLHVLLRAARLNTHYVDRLGLLAAYFAAMIHDHGHPGLTGDFLIATSHPLALRYNDRSPLESHHAASAFELLAARPDLDITEGLSREEKAAFRKQVIEMVLATDMKQHFALQGQFTAVAHRRGGTAEGSRTAAALTATDSGGGACGAAAAAVAGVPSPGRNPAAQHKGGLLGTAGILSTGGNDMLSTNSNAAASLGGIGSGGGNASCHSSSLVATSAAAAPQPLDEVERMLSLQIALKVADIGHLAGELGVHKRWLGVLEEEFFRQGDQERALGLPISPLFDRAKQGVSKSQVGFFDFVALPLVRTFASAFPGAQQVAACFEANYNYWVEVQQQQQEKQ